MALPLDHELGQEQIWIRPIHYPRDIRINLPQTITPVIYRYLNQSAETDMKKLTLCLSALVVGQQAQAPVRVVLEQVDDPAQRVQPAGEQAHAVHADGFLIKLLSANFLELLTDDVLKDSIIRVEQHHTRLVMRYLIIRVGGV